MQAKKGERSKNLIMTELRAGPSYWDTYKMGLWSVCMAVHHCYRNKGVSVI